MPLSNLVKSNLVKKITAALVVTTTVIIAVPNAASANVFQRRDNDDQSTTWIDYPNDGNNPKRYDNQYDYNEGKRRHHPSIRFPIFNQPTGYWNQPRNPYRQVFGLICENGRCDEIRFGRWENPRYMGFHEENRNGVWIWVKYPHRRYHW